MSTYRIRAATRGDAVLASFCPVTTDRARAFEHAGRLAAELLATIGHGAVEVQEAQEPDEDDEDLEPGWKAWTVRARVVVDAEHPLCRIGFGPGRAEPRRNGRWQQRSVARLSDEWAFLYGIVAWTVESGYAVVCGGEYHPAELAPDGLVNVLDPAGNLRSTVTPFAIRPSTVRVEDLSSYPGLDVPASELRA